MRELEKSSGVFTDVWHKNYYREKNKNDGTISSHSKIRCNKNEKCESSRAHLTSTKMKNKHFICWTLQCIFVKLKSTANCGSISN